MWGVFGVIWKTPTRSLLSHLAAACGEEDAVAGGVPNSYAASFPSAQLVRPPGAGLLSQRAVVSANVGNPGAGPHPSLTHFLCQARGNCCSTCYWATDAQKEKGSFSSPLFFHNLSGRLPSPPHTHTHAHTPSQPPKAP